MKEEIKHFKSLLRQGSLRHMNILLDDKFQKELQTIIEDYEKLQQENKRQKEVIDEIMNLIKQYGKYDGKKCTCGFQMWSADFNKILDMLKEVSE